MTLYYQDETVTLYHANCLTDHREWLDADILVTDPPYGSQGMASNYGRNDRTIAGDQNTEVRDAALSAWGPKPVACFGSPRLPEPPGEWVDRLVWDKVEPGMNKGPFRYTHENIYLRGDGWTRSSTRSYSILRFPRSDGMGNEERAQHPHRKPVGLLEALIAAAPAGVISDPFAGSGSTLVAAKNLGRKAIGVEMEEQYCEIIAKRLSQGVLDFGEAA